MKHFNVNNPSRVIFFDDDHNNIDAVCNIEQIQNRNLNTKLVPSYLQEPLLLKYSKEIGHFKDGNRISGIKVGNLEKSREYPNGFRDVNGEYCFTDKAFDIISKENIFPARPDVLLRKS